MTQHIHVNAPVEIGRARPSSTIERHRLPSLRITNPCDPSEREADAAADRAVLGAPVGILNRVPVRMATGSIVSESASHYLAATLDSPGRPLDDSARTILEPRFGSSFGEVRLHDDAAARSTAAAIGARAFSVGRHIGFAAGAYAPHTAAGLRLLAHEVAHVTQIAADQRQSGRTVAQEVDAAATEPVLVHRQAIEADAGVAPPPAATVLGSTPGQRVIEALSRPNPVAGIGNSAEALAILRTLDIEELLDAVLDVDAHGQLDLLVDALGASDVTEVGAVVYAARATSPNGTPSDQFAVQAARGLALIPQPDQDRILARVLARRGGGISVDDIREGLQALQESEAALDTEGTEEVEADASPQALIAGIAIGPWNPGNMPIPYYIGNAAHVAIAGRYAYFHRGDAAFYNFSSVAAILGAAAALGISVNPAAIRAARLGLKPDIANLSRRHLYEIKPATSQGLGRAEARLYQAAFMAAGLAMALGPIGEPGTSGSIPAPGGVFAFSAPEPGVIVYRYRQPRRRRVRQPASQRSPETSRSLVEKVSIATGLTGGALAIYLIISEGSRLFPPRNLVPIP